MNQTIASIIQEFSLNLYRPIIKRDLDLGDALPPRAGNLVKVIIGMRRSGKTFRLFQEMDSLINAGIPAERLCYFNFEDNRIAPATPETGDAVLETFQALHPDVDYSRGIYLFFDELQEMEGWGAWLRRVVDTRRATIYISGSSSKMLSSEIATEFRGRAIDFELLPYSYRELAQQDPLLAGHLDDEVPTEERRLRLEHLLRRYLDRGGFPAVQDMPLPQANALLQSYAQRVTARDVVERHNVARPRVASALANRLMSLNAKTISIRKIENDLRSAGLGVGRAYLSDLLSYYEEAFLCFQVKEFTLSLSEHSTAMPKLYAIDPGLALANSRAGVNDLGQRLEDAVYLELRRRMPAFRTGAISKLHTKSHGYEIDFVVGDALEMDAFELLQVTEAMDEPATIERETRALWEALDETGLLEGTIVVGDGKYAEYERDGKRIVQIPAWRWLLNSDTAPGCM